VRTIESIGFHAGRYWPLEAALWYIAGQAVGAALAAKAAGFRAFKIRISRTDWRASLESVRAARHDGFQG
jgi:D-galactarolactone cycloisomerase